MFVVLRVVYMDSSVCLDRLAWLGMEWRVALVKAVSTTLAATTSAARTYHPSIHIIYRTG